MLMILVFQCTNCSFAFEDSVVLQEVNLNSKRKKNEISIEGSMLASPVNYELGLEV